MNKRTTSAPEILPVLQVPQLLTVVQVAAALGIGKSTVYQLMNQDGLPYVEVRGTRRVSVKGLTWWITQKERSTDPQFQETQEKERAEKAEKEPVSIKGYQRKQKGKKPV